MAGFTLNPPRAQLGMFYTPIQNPRVQFRQVIVQSALLTVVTVYLAVHPHGQCHVVIVVGTFLAHAWFAPLHAMSGRLTPIVDCGTRSRIG
jgi:hypothetical protein